MKTIAISIDEASLAALDRLARTAARLRGGRRRSNRSEVVRRAVREFLDRGKRQGREDNDRRILAANRAHMAGQAAALVREQAEP